MSDIFAIKDVMDFTVETYVTSGRGDILFRCEYAKSSTINSPAERIDVAGGGSNYRITALDHGRRTSVANMLPLLDVNALANKLGVALSTGATTANNSETKTTTGATPTITLASTPISGTLKVYLVESGTVRDLGTEQTAGTPATTENEYSISGTEITLNATTAPAGTKVFVSYDYTSGANAKNLKITADNFPSCITIRGRGFYDDETNCSRVPVSFKVHKAKVKPEFELTMAGDAVSEFNFEVDCFTVENSAGQKEEIDIVILTDEI